MHNNGRKPMPSAKKPKQSTASKTKSAPPAKKPAATTSPLIDTSLAAQAAARMVAHGPTAPTPAGEQPESAAFKKLKESLAKPTSTGVASFLQNTAPVKKSGQPFGQQNQMRRGQTFGADVNRSGVPRRTGG
jgi:hypothetical protein